MFAVGRLLVVLSTFFFAKCIVRSSTYIENTGLEDLETSASGYSYQGRSGTPFDYKSISSETDGDPDEFENSFESIGRYSHHPMPLHLLPLSPNLVPSYDSKYINSYGEVAPYAKGYDNFENGDLNHYGRQSTNFVKDGGSNYEDAERASHGEKGEKGYSNRDEFANGLRGRHQNEQKKGFYDVLGGNKRGHEEEERYHDTKHRSAQGNNAASFSAEKSHDKGSKTTGYHKVYHKDEYKKNKNFYDKKDQKGHFNRHGNFNSKGSTDSGVFINGKSLDAGFKEGKFGAAGQKEKGKFLDEASGYRDANGDLKYHNNEAAYENQAGTSSNADHGYSEGDKKYAGEK